jgi:hypothetical protein
MPLPAPFPDPDGNPVREKINQVIAFLAEQFPPNPTDTVVVKPDPEDRKKRIMRQDRSWITVECQNPDHTPVSETMCANLANRGFVEKCSTIKSVP